MGRGRVELKRIENKINRQVTFAKRRNGLLKKAYELSVLCEAEVALIIFSNRGKLYEFCSSSSMLKTLERYQKCNYGAPEPNVSARDALELSSQQEYLKLKARYEALQRTQRNLLGEDLGPLNSKELESLERQLDMSLKQIRSTRTQYMLDQLTDLQRQEHFLREANKNLRERLVEGYHVQSLQLNPSAEDVAYGRQQSQPQGDGFFHPLDCEPTLQIGYPTYPITTAGPSVHRLSLFLEKLKKKRKEDEETTATSTASRSVFTGFKRPLVAGAQSAAIASFADTVLGPSSGVGPTADGGFVVLEEAVVFSDLSGGVRVADAGDICCVDVVWIGDVLYRVHIDALGYWIGYGVLRRWDCIEPLDVGPFYFL
ncbi:sepallata 3 [Tripterygium wilfordii]|uniref:Sepallata 3 n=1 Tax=Tripterygium wilfordii TaxID=458696 RepID=A0A7J7D545_TRIWF|nr:sepallata 3 [Tripterygium wilfordii]